MFEHDIEKETCNECPICFSHRVYDFQDKGNLLGRIMLYLHSLTQFFLLSSFIAIS